MGPPPQSASIPKANRSSVQHMAKNIQRAQPYPRKSKRDEISDQMEKSNAVPPRMESRRTTTPGPIGIGLGPDDPLPSMLKLVINAIRRRGTPTMPSIAAIAKASQANALSGEPAFGPVGCFFTKPPQLSSREKGSCNSSPLTYSPFVLACDH